MEQEATARVQTVLSAIEPSDLGPTLMHEHLFSDLRSLIREPEGISDRMRAHEPITLENLGWLRQYWFCHYDNLILDRVETAIREVLLFKRWGGRTIVDVTPAGIGRDPVALAQVANATGVNVVMATGWYIQSTHPPDVATMGRSELAERMASELDEGIVDVYPAQADLEERRIPTGVKPGIIKVAGTWPLTEDERRVLLAAADVQRETGVAITCHTGRNERSPLEMLEVLQEGGADIDRVVMGHLDLRVQNVSVLREIGASGCYLEFDLFGMETSFYPFTQADMPGDGQRLDMIAEVISDGLVERVLISHDIAHKHRLTTYGGHGYAHILQNVVPFMRKKGFSDTDIHMITVENAARVLAVGTRDSLQRSPSLAAFTTSE